MGLRRDGSRVSLELVFSEAQLNRRTVRLVILRDRELIMARGPA